MSPKIAIIYLCHGNLRHLPEVVSSFEHLEYPHENITIVMIPNGSPDGIAEVIRSNVLPRSGQDLPEVVLIDDGINHGFAGGNNLGIKWALERDFDYVFLNNGDLKLHPKAISKLVEKAQDDRQVGSVQSMVLYWDDQKKVNVSGGVFHIAGYGYARDNTARLDQIDAKDGEEVIYCSGAAVLYRASALKKVGLLEEGFFMYHEDLELGLRLRMAGYKNILAKDSEAYHDYCFSRNPKKFAWMELYRWVVVLSYYKISTLILFLPLLCLIEAGSWMMSITGGWFKAKLWALSRWFVPSTWQLIFKMRRRARRLRQIKDRDLLKFVTGKIEAQETKSFIVDQIANPIIDLTFRLIRSVITW
ncbi:MAG: glycosyltransferase family 2 protein [Patescibacteria group bacterium]